MKDRKLDDWLLDLGPNDLSGDLLESLKEQVASDENAKAALERELRYLQLVSSRKVILPNDAYFAQARQKMLEKVRNRPASVWSMVRDAVIPRLLKPIPVAVSGALLTIAFLALLVYHSPTKRMEHHGSYGRYVSIGENYEENVAKVEDSRLSEQELREYRQILIMSAAILGSPSSLSRSQALAGGGK